jgi:hypothetical protein
LAQPSTAPRNQCFNSSDWRGWKAIDEHSMYINVNLHTIYRVDFASACPEILDPGAHLVTEVRGSSQICSPLDWDLKVSDDHGFSAPCFVSGMTQLTPAQAAAIPRKDRP